MTAKILEFKQEPSDPRWQTAKNYLKDRQYDKALEVFEDLAEDGFAGANYYIGSLYENGRGVERPDMEAARYWYMRGIDAADDGEAYIGMARLALGGYKDAGSFSDAADYLRKACDKDNPRAMIGLGTLYHMGKGVERDFRQAAQWYERAIAHGYVLPMRFLSKLRFQEGAYASGVRLRLKSISMAYRIALEDVDDDRLWNYLTPKSELRLKRLKKLWAG